MRSDRSMLAEMAVGMGEAAWYIGSEAVGLYVAACLAALAGPPLVAFVVWDRWRARRSADAWRRSRECRHLSASGVWDGIACDGCRGRFGRVCKNATGHTARG